MISSLFLFGKSVASSENVSSVNASTGDASVCQMLESQSIATTRSKGQMSKNYCGGSILHEAAVKSNSSENYEDFKNSTTAKTYQHHGHHEHFGSSHSTTTSASSSASSSHGSSESTANNSFFPAHNNRVTDQEVVDQHIVAESHPFHTEHDGSHDSLVNFIVDDDNRALCNSVVLQESLEACLLSNQQQASEISINLRELGELEQKVISLELNQSFLKSNNTLLIKGSKECIEEKNKLQKENHELAIQLEALQEKYDKKVSLLKSNIKELHKKLLNVEAQNEKKSKDYIDSIEEANRLEKELQHVYIKSQSTYVNTTLIIEDFGWALMKTLDCIVEVCENIIYSSIVTELLTKVWHVLKPCRKKCLSFYNKLHGKEPFKTIGKWLKSVDFIEGIRLTLVSVTIDGSKAALNYLETTKKLSPHSQDDDANGRYITSSRHRHHDYLFHRHGLNNRRGRDHIRHHYPISNNKKVSKTGPKVFKLVKILLRYTERNAETLVNCSLIGGSLLLACSMIRKIVMWLLRKATNNS